MKNQLLKSILCAGLFAYSGLSNVASAQAPDWAWAKSSGNTFAAQYVMNTVTDNDDNSYITGWFTSSTLVLGGISLSNSGNDKKAYIAKYDPNGDVLWAKAAGGNSLNSESWAIAIDASNNVYISGIFSSATITYDSATLNHTGNGSDLFLVKYDSNGNLIWAKDVDYSTSLWLLDMDVDLNGNIFLAGSFSYLPITFGSTTLQSISNTHPFIAKFDTAGNVLWAKAPQNSTSYSNWGTAIASDLLGNVFSSGNYLSADYDPFIIDGITLPNTNNNRNIYLVKYDASGNVIWIKTSVGTTSSSGGDYPYDLASDTDGNVIIIGAMRSSNLYFDAVTIMNSNSNNTPDIFLAKYDGNGNAVWAKNAGGSGYDEGHRVTTDSYNNVYATGYFESKPASFGAITISKVDSYSPIFFVAQYDENGNETWVKHLETTSGHSGNLPSNGVAVNSLGNIYVVGTAYSNAVFGTTTLSQGGIFIAKMGSSTTSIEEVESSYSEINIYPNPNNGQFVIEGRLSDFSIEVHNALGQLLRSQRSLQQRIQIDLQQQPSGIYHVSVRAEDEVSLFKVVKQ